VKPYALYQAMKLDRKLRERYSRMLALRDFSENDMEAIMNTTVAQVGAGGLGSPALRLMAAIGFGRILIVDRDIVELSNIQRQTVYDTEDIGRPKAEAAAKNLQRMNPNAEYEPICASIDESNAEGLLAGADIIVDGLDSFRARRIVNRVSLARGIPYVFAGAVEYYANLSTFIPGKTGCLQCVMGKAEDNPENSCARVGVSPMLLSIAASIEVEEVVRLATGKTPALANRLLTIDIENMSFDAFDIGRNENCSACSPTKKQSDDQASELSATLLCSQSYSISGSRTSIDLDRIEQKSGGTKKRRTAKSLRIETSDGAITLMSSGSAIVKGVKSPDEALRLYKKFVS
jgi:adenylyltransferase/sulfurtransferase